MSYSLSKLFRIILIVLDVILLALAEYDWEKNGDYCDIKKKQGGGRPCDTGGYKSTGCPSVCAPNKGVIHIVSDLVLFRQTMVDIHNELRQHLASGKEGNLTSGPAANMNALSYDMELEYLATCWSVNKGWGHMGKLFHDQCSRALTFDGDDVGQNLYHATVNDDFINPKLFFIGPRLWYDEVVDMDDSIIEKFVGHGRNNSKVGHMTAMSWATITHLGCARSEKVQKVKGPTSYYNFGLACDYTGIDVMGPNMRTMPVYKKGPPCSACRKGRKCNSKYNALCGEIAPTPTDVLRPIGLKRKGRKGGLFGRGAGVTTRRQSAGSAMLTVFISTMLMLLYLFSC